MKPLRNLLLALLGGATVFSSQAQVFLGDTYSIGILVQDATTAFHISNLSPSTHTLDLTPEFAGNNQVGTAGGTFSVTESVIPLGPGSQRVTVSVTALDVTGAPEPWVTSGVLSPNNVPFTTWRLDLGSTAGGADGIAISPLTTVVSSGFEVFNSAGSSLGAFALTLDDSVNGSKLSGVGVVGTGGGDIAGFDMATFAVHWDVQVVPEPHEYALMAGVGLLGFAAWRRRRA